MINQNIDIDHLHKIYPDNSNKYVCDNLNITMGQLRGLISRRKLKKSRAYFNMQQKIKSDKYHKPIRNI